METQFYVKMYINVPLAGKTLYLKDIALIYDLLLYQAFHFFIHLLHN